MSFENIVRPFQQAGVFSARSIVPNAAEPSKDPNAPEEAKATWSGSQSSTWQETLAPIISEWKVEDWQEDVGQRETETVRVENPNNSNQYVDVERIKRAVFKTSNGGTLGLRMGGWG